MIPTINLDMDLARACCRASEQAYDFPPEVETQLAHVVVRAGPAMVGGPAGEAMDPDWAGPLIIAFRGTASLHDVITDAEVGFNSWTAYKLGASMRVRANETVIHEESGIEVHRGFLQAFTSALDPLLAKLRETCALPEQILTMPIVVTGHSLGGALAMLCAKSLTEMLMNVQAVYTFGQPRVGNRLFAESYNRALNPAVAGPSAGLGAATWRFVNEEDPVPRVPGLLAGYRHAGNEAFLPSTGGQPILNPGLTTKLISDAWGFYREWKQGGPLECLGDHRITEYLRRVGVPIVQTDPQEQSKVL